MVSHDVCMLIRHKFKITSVFVENRSVELGLQYLHADPCDGNQIHVCMGPESVSMRTHKSTLINAHRCPRTHVKITESTTQPSLSFLSAVP